LQRKLQPEIERIKKEFPDKQEQSQKMLELYKERKTNPFAGCLLVLVQIPIIFALYRVFLQGLVVDPEILYATIRQPEMFNTLFLGIDLGAKSIILAIIAGLTQFVQISLSPAMKSMPKTEEKEEGETDSNDMMQMVGGTMQKQMKFMMPIIITVVAAFVPAAVALYWVVNNITTIATDFIARKLEERKEAKEEVLVV
jgi:YidC/Oxa1 family membrane protein insertase